jgi:hypothetical protein
MEVNMRIGINIPDDLIKRLEPLKPNINISQICREAVTKYIELYERAEKQADIQPIMKKVSEAAQKEKVIFLDWETLGLEDAKLWSEKAKPDNWEQLFERLDALEGFGKSPFDSEFPVPRVAGAKTYIDRQYEYDIENGWFSQRLNSVDNPYITARLEWQKGFLLYIIVIRRKVRQKVEADLKEQQGKFKRLKESLRANTEIPNSLLQDK